MSIVFVAGSRLTSRLPAEVKARLDTMIDDLRDLLAQGDSDSVERIVAELDLEVMQ